MIKLRQRKLNTFIYICISILIYIIEDTKVFVNKRSIPRPTFTFIKRKRESFFLSYCILYSIYIRLWLMRCTICVYFIWLLTLETQL